MKFDMFLYELSRFKQDNYMSIEILICKEDISP